jgi:hypothetical protein
MRGDDWTEKADHARQVAALMKNGDLKRQWELIERGFRSQERRARGAPLPSDEDCPDARSPVLAL